MAASKPPLFHLPARLTPDVILLRTVNGFWITWLSSSASSMARRPESPVSFSSLVLELSGRSWYSSCTGVCRRRRILGQRSPCLTTLGSRSTLLHLLSQPLPPLPLLLPITQPLLALRTRLPLRKPKRDVEKTSLITLLNFCVFLTSLLSLWGCP